MDTSLTVRNTRRQAWALMLRKQPAGGLSVRDWCRQNHLSVKAFYYRRRQVQAKVLEAAEKIEFAELVMPEPVPGMTSSLFLSVRIQIKIIFEHITIHHIPRKGICEVYMHPVVLKPNNIDNPPFIQDCKNRTVGAGLRTHIDA